MAQDAGAEDGLRTEVLKWIRAIRYGGVTLPDLHTELRLIKGLNVTLEAVFGTLEALRSAGLIECLSDGEWIQVTQAEPVVAKQTTLF